MIWAIRLAVYNRPAMPVYLDHAATTPLRPEVLEAMLPFLGGTFGNPSSVHAFGRLAREALDDAHERLARSIGADGREIVFTSGGTEASNLALKGAAWAGKARGHRIVTTPIEHHAVGHTLDHLQKFGFEVVEVPVDRYGRVDPADVERAITDRTTLVTVMLANNEVGTIQPVAEVAAVVRARRGVLLHVDAVQAAPWVDLDVDALGAHLVALGAHKAEGPKGTGALWIRRGTHILAQQHGGSQERYRRAGTENLAGAVGMAIAFELRAAELRRSSRRSGPGATGCWRRSSPSTGSSRPVIPSSGCRTSHPSSFPGRMAATSRSPWTSRASRCRPVRPAPAARPRSATCSPRWATRPTRRGEPCA